MGCCQGGSSDNDRDEPMIDRGRGGDAGKRGWQDRGKATGQDFGTTAKDRDKYKEIEDDLPELPFNKEKEVCAEIDLQVKDAKYLPIYKKEFRAALARKKAKGEPPRLFRLYDKCLHPADETAGPNENRKGVRERIVASILPTVMEDLMEGFKEDGLGISEDEMEKKGKNQMRRLVQERMHDILHYWAEKTFKKDQRGEDANVSDDEQEAERSNAEREKQRAERKKQIAAEREAEAKEFAEQTGSASPSSGRPPPSLSAPKRNTGSGNAKVDPAFKKKCEDFYRHYAPEKVATVDDMLLKRIGNQQALDEMWGKMVNKYGPWPLPGKGGAAAPKAKQAAKPAAKAAAKPAAKQAAKATPAPAAAKPGADAKDRPPSDTPVIDEKLRLKGSCGELPAPPAGTTNREPHIPTDDKLELKGKSDATQKRLKRSNLCVDGVRSVIQVP
eukprot:Hpha_TRINITY_DN6799_c0_g2::TRINITY_DN6799_c0_g2_i1::g.110861::m.110861